MAVHAVSTKDLQPGDRVVDGNEEYEVHAIEQEQGRLLVIDTAGGVHTYPVDSSLRANRGGSGGGGRSTQHPGPGIRTVQGCSTGERVASLIVVGGTVGVGVGVGDLDLSLR